MPSTWSASNTGQPVGTRDLYAVMFNVGSGSSVSDFDFCIESALPISSTATANIWAFFNGLL